MQWVRPTDLLVLGAAAASVMACLVGGSLWLAVGAALLSVPIALARGLSAPVSLAASAAAGSALIHLAVAPEHFEEWWGFGLFFVLAGEAQLAWALALRRRAPSWLFATGIAGSVVLVALWILSRSVGLPFGPDPGEAEPVGVADLVSVALEGVTVLGAALALYAVRSGASRARTGQRLGLGLATAGLTAWALSSVFAAVPG